MWLIPTIRLTLLLLIKNSNNVVHSSVLRVFKVEGQMKEDKLFVIQYYQNLSKGTFFISISFYQRVLSLSLCGCKKRQYDCLLAPANKVCCQEVTLCDSAHWSQIWACRRNWRNKQNGGNCLINAKTQIVIIVDLEHNKKPNTTSNICNNKSCCVIASYKTWRGKISKFSTTSKLVQKRDFQTADKNNEDKQTKLDRVHEVNARCTN